MIALRGSKIQHEYKVLSVVSSINLTSQLVFQFLGNRYDYYNIAALRGLSLNIDGHRASAAKYKNLGPIAGYR